MARRPPTWRGEPLTSRWLIPDPAGIQGSQSAQRVAFISTLAALERSIAKLLDLKVEHQYIDRVRLQRRLDDIGQTMG